MANLFAIFKTGGWLARIGGIRRRDSEKHRSAISSLQVGGSVANLFAIFKTADGSLVSVESDDAIQRSTDPQLAALGLGRVGIAQFPDITHVWNPATRTLQIQAAPVDILATLRAKASSTWVVPTDVADFLKNR